MYCSVCSVLAAYKNGTVNEQNKKKKKKRKGRASYLPPQVVTDEIVTSTLVVAHYIVNCPLSKCTLLGDDTSCVRGYFVTGGIYRGPANNQTVPGDSWHWLSVDQYMILDPCKNDLVIIVRVKAGAAHAILMGSGINSYLPDDRCGQAGVVL